MPLFLYYAIIIFFLKMQREKKAVCMHNIEGCPDNRGCPDRERPDIEALFFSKKKVCLYEYWLGLFATMAGFVCVNIILTVGCFY